MPWRSPDSSSGTRTSTTSSSTPERWSRRSRSSSTRYSHFLLGNWVGASVPVWLREGLAEVYATFQERDGGKSAVLGAPDPDHLRLLQNTSLIPLQDLIAVTQMSPIYNEGDRRGVLYAESWALVHYLMYGNKARAPQLTAFLAAVKSGAPARIGVPRRIRRCERARSGAERVHPPLHVSRTSAEFRRESRWRRRAARHGHPRRRWPPHTSAISLPASTAPMRHARP